jgi:hypothetical protein
MQGFTRRDLLKAGLAASAAAMATEKNLHAVSLASAPAAVVPTAGPPQISIVVQKEEDVVLEFAAQDLARYLGQITGETIVQGMGGAAHRIYLGEIPVTAQLEEAAHLSAEVKGLELDGFIISSMGPDVVILGNGSRGVLYGCYAFLELQGVRWYFPGRQHEIVPHHPVNWDTHFKLNESPAFPKRILFYWPNNYSSPLDWIDFCAKARLNRLAFHYTWPAKDWYILLRTQLLPELRKRGMEIEVGGHFLSTFLPRTLFQEHPEWFRMNEQGNRIADFNLNPFNRDALEYLTSRASEYLQQTPEASLFHLWADDIDGGGWSHESGMEISSPSDQALLVSNFLVKKVRQKLPAANVAYLAYHDTVNPPRVVKPNPGVIYLYAPRERCYAHALDDPACGLNRRYAQALEDGLPAFGSANAEVFEYYADEILYESTTNPPMPDVIGADLRYYRRLRIPAVGVLMTQTSNFLSPLVNMFLYPQGLWNPQRDLSLSLDEYARLYFGDARLTGYFRKLTQGMKDVLKVCAYQHPGDAWDSVRVDAEPDDALRFHVSGLEAAIIGTLAEARDVLDRSLAEIKSPTYVERLKGEQASMNFTLRQAKLFYHLLKGECLYRAWKSRHEQESGLGALTELGLARHAWNCQEKFIAIAGMKAIPQMPGLLSLEARARELSEAITTNPKSVAGINIGGFAIDRLDGQLPAGVTGYVAAGPTGSRAVLWTDVASSRFALRPGDPRLSWFDEYGKPIGSDELGCFDSAVVAEAKGMPVDKLFGALLKSQLAFENKTGG